MTSLPNPSAAVDPVAASLRNIGELISKGQTFEAERICMPLLEAYPHRHDINNLMGVIYVGSGKRSKAVQYFEAAVKAQPSNAVYLNNLGRLYLDLDLIELALPPLNRALSINPRLSETLWAIGEYYRSAGKADKGLPYIEKALLIDPNNSAIKNSLANSLDALGRADDAKTAFEALMQSRRQRPLAVFRLSHIGRPTVDSKLFSEIQALMGAKDLGPTDRSRVHAAAALLYENSGNYVSAFEHFEQSNKLEERNYDIGVFRAWVDKAIAVITPEFFAKRRDYGHPSELPVFVVGMPRSGTTLTELIIAAHPQAGGAGELARINRFAKRLSYHTELEKFSATIDAHGRDKVRELAENFIGLLRFHAPDATRVVDKLPHNFINLGFIGLLFPNARIIHCRRNAVDTCWSCYQNRLNDSHFYSRNLKTLGLYYREYTRLMNHWRKVVPMRFHESNYEALTEDPEKSVKELLQFLDLPWDPGCLEFHKSETTVSTISQKQVRQPVYKTSVERWRHYESQLQPLVEALGDLA